MNRQLRPEHADFYLDRSHIKLLRSLGIREQELHTQAATHLLLQEFKKRLCIQKTFETSKNDEKI